MWLEKYANDKVRIKAGGKTSEGEVIDFLYSDENDNNQNAIVIRLGKDLVTFYENEIDEITSIEN